MDHGCFGMGSCPLDNHLGRLDPRGCVSAAYNVARQRSLLHQRKVEPRLPAQLNSDGPGCPSVIREKVITLADGDTDRGLKTEPIGCCSDATQPTLMR